jgi:aquaporin related protein
VGVARLETVTVTILYVSVADPVSNVRTTLGGGTSIAQGLFIEMFLTSL